MIWVLAEVLNTMAEFLIVLLYYNSIMPRRIKNKWIFAGGYIAAGTVLSFVSIAADLPENQLATTVILLFALAFGLYGGKIISRIFYVLFFILIIFLSESLFAQFLSLLHFGTPESFLYSGQGRLLGMVGSKIFYFWFVVIISRVFSKKVKELPFKYWIMVILMPIISAFIIDAVFIASETENLNRVTFMLCVAGLIYINFSVFHYFETYSRQIRLSVVEQVLEREEKNYDLLEQSYTDMRQIQHDIQNQIMVLERLSTENKSANAKELISGLTEIVKANAAVCYTGNPAVDSLVNIKGQQAKEKGIDFIPKIYIKDICALNTVDLCRILGNALDNAIEACEKLPDEKRKYICISFRQSADNIKIEITNPSDQVDVTNLHTTKANRSMHGIGINSIRRSAERLGGGVSFRYENGIFTFEMVIFT